MTIIVYRDGVMAADSAAWHGSVRVSYEKRKIYRLKDGSLFGCAGASATIQTVRAWADLGFSQEGKPKDEKEEDFEGLLITPEGVAKGVSHDMIVHHLAPAAFHCVGQPDFVYGALAMGATAEEAVRLAIRWCDYAGGECFTEHLHPALSAAAD